MELTDTKKNLNSQSMGSTAVARTQRILKLQTVDGFVRNFSRGFTIRVAELLPPGRNRRLAMSIASGVFTKGLGTFLTLATVPMTLQYLGPERYGIWVTMISILAWLNIVEFGIANGLAPALSGAFGKNRNDLAQEYIATAFWALTGFVIVTGLLISAVWGWISWGQIFNISEPKLELQVTNAVALAIGIILVKLPLSITHRVLLAYQQGLAANLWQLLINLVGVAGIYAVSHTQGGLVYLVLGYSGTQVVVLLASAVWLFAYSRPHLHPLVRPNWGEAKYVLSLGGMFFINEIAALLIFQKDNVLITHFLGPAQATPFSVTWQLFFYLNAINMLVSPYLGPSFGEAYAAGDLSWMREAFKRYMISTATIAIPGVMLLAWFHRPILTAWVGPGVMPTTMTVVWMALWTSVLAIQWPMTSMLTGTGQLRRFTIFYPLSALLNVFLSIFFIKEFGVSGGIIASTIITFLCVTLPSLREVLILLKRSK